MFEALIATGQLLVAGLSIPSIQPNKKRTVGRKLSALHNDLILLYENGSRILDSFTEHNSGKNIDLYILKKLLIEQHYLIPKILSFFDNREIQTIFNIKAPELLPLKFHLYDKSDRVAFYLNQYNSDTHRSSRPETLEWLSKNPRIELPSQDEINNSKNELESIRSFTEGIREFLVGHFDINEII